MTSQEVKSATRASFTREELQQLLNEVEGQDSYILIFRNKSDKTGTKIPTHDQWVKDNPEEHERGKTLLLSDGQKRPMVIQLRHRGGGGGGEKNLFGFWGKIRCMPANKVRSFSASPAKPLNQSVYSVCQGIEAFGNSSGITSGANVQFPFIAATASTPLQWQLAFELNDLSQVSTFTTAFDQYRIDKVEVRLQSKDNAINTLSAASPNNGTSHIIAVLDFDDASTLGSLAAALEYDNFDTVQYGQNMFLEVHPTMALATWAGGVFSGYNITKAGWIDCSNTQVAHYGLKGIVTALTVSSTQEEVWYVVAKYYVSFRNTR